MKDPRTSRPGTKQRTIADHCEQGKTKREVYALLSPLVRDQVRGWIFSANVNGRRIPKSQDEQLQELKNSIGRIYSYLGRSKGSQFEDEEIPQEDTPKDSPPPKDEQEDENEQDEDEKPRAKGKRNLKDEWEYFKRRHKEIRRWCIERDRMGDFVDWISMRPRQAAAKLIAAGIPADVLLLAMAMHWAPDVRRAAGIDDFDFNTDGAFVPHPGMLEVSQRIIREREIDPEGKHALFGYVLLLVENRIPVMAIGPAGTGKSFIAEQVADFLGLDYGETPMSSGATRSDMLGRHTINQDRPFVSAQFQEQYSGGGLHSLEEIDRADPGTLIVLHNALARDVLYNTVTGEKHRKHDDFCAFANANSFALGANRRTTTGERLDEATVDRFRMGRVYLPIDEDMEDSVYDREFSANLHKSH